MPADLFSDDGLSLSFAQQRLWFMDQLAPGNPFYNVTTAYRIDGPLDVPILERALTEIVVRHETLRTRFVSVAGVPRQVIDEPAPVTVLVDDLHDAADPVRQARETARSAALEPFDLAKGPLLRVRLLRLGHEEQVLLVTMHHIVTDAWSLDVFNAELSILYAAFTDGRPAPLPPLPIQYADFAEWQRSWLSGDVLDRQLAYWRDRLGDMPAALELPLDRPRPPTPSYLADEIPFALPADLLARLGALAAAHRSTLFMTLLAGFDALLARCTGAGDVVVGVPVAGRSRSELEDLIGFFVNSLVIRVDCSDDPDFVTLLGRVREAVLGAYDHQDLPFEKLVEELDPLRDPSRNPLFQVGFHLQQQRSQAGDGSARSLALPGTTVRVFEGHEVTTRLDLELYCAESPEGLSGRLVYATDLFDQGTMERLAEHFVRLLTQIAEAPHRKVSELSLLTEEELHRQVVEWNDTAEPFDPERTVVDLFEAQAARDPEAVAVSCAGRSLTYGELNLRANQLAHHLRGLGVGPEVRVALCAERGLDLMVGLLGIMKAGGAYLPLDPTYPAERIGFMLADAACPVVVTQHTLGLLTGTARVVHLDADADLLAAAPTQNPARRVHPDNVAYVIYTSGSTGRPKGVEVVHRGLTNLIGHLGQAFGVGPGSRILQYSSVCFDASVMDVWFSWTTGAELVIAPRHLLGAELAEQLAASRITQVLLVPSVLGTLPETPLPHLTTLLIGGEAAEPGLVNHWSPGRNLVNLFGPTEATVAATGFWCTAPVTRTPPIGRPLGNTQVYLLDDRLRPVPVGATGEIYLGGTGISRGYLNRPGLTASRFVADPYGAPGGRLYRTGDLGRYLPDGAIEFVGRRDLQVKLRGLRVELGEIEATLAQHPVVRQVTVAVRDSPGRSRRLVGYVVPEPSVAGNDDGLSSEHVRGWREIFEKAYRSLPPGAVPDGADDGDARWATTVARVSSRRPARLLEIGCGAGLLTRRLMPYCEGYLATDFATAAVDRLRFDPYLAGRDGLRFRVVDASDLTEYAGHSFEAVVVEAVARYLPSLSHLDRVVRQAVEVVADGGIVIVGDVRSLSLLDAFHATTALAAADSDDTVTALVARVRQAVDEDMELAVAPEWFAALPQRLSRVSYVEVVPRTTGAGDQDAWFGYEVVIHVAAGSGALRVPRWHDWHRDGLDLDVLRRLLVDSPPVLGVTRVPNGRLLGAVRIADRLLTSAGARTVGMLRQVPAAAADGVDPDELQALADELGYTVRFSWSGGGEHGDWDIAFVHGSYPPDAPVDFPVRAAGPARLANDPLRSRRNTKLRQHHLPQLREFARQRLPEYMVPSGFVLLDRLPLTPSGKVDQAALPDPDLEATPTGRAPNGPAEAAVCELFAEVLQRDRVGPDDNFFDLGGHSLLGIRLLNLIRSRLDLDISLRALFMRPTAAGIAAYLEPAAPTDGGDR